ncbi:uncharacterized protein LOC135497650 [Lineus longissimus]|uniref:uncharacterized protein LOC135497650 n=1 Tax=Lineus longissimus TaxID=88925 RepID=UPI002B4D31E5
MAEHNKLKLAVMWLTFGVFVGLMVISALAGQGDKIQTALFLNTTAAVSDFYYLEITPAGWTFSVWGVIYTWQALWIVYSLIGTCRKSAAGYVYDAPSFAPTLMYVFYILNNIFNAAWLVLWDRKIIGAALGVIALIPFTLYICLALSFKGLHDNRGAMRKYGLCRDIGLTIGLTQNGMALYATWTSVATLLNLAMVLTYIAGVDNAVACTSSLSILAVELVLWFVMDIFFLDKFTRYIVTPYFIIILACSGITAEHWDPTSRNSIFTIVLLGVGVVALLSKVTILVWRHYKRPLQVEDSMGMKVKFVNASNPSIMTE